MTNLTIYPNMVLMKMSKDKSSAIFVRLHGCNYKCKRCPAERGEDIMIAHGDFSSDTLTLPVVNIVEMISKVLPSDPYLRIPPSVIISGEEPFLQTQGVFELLELLRIKNYQRHVMTNGSLIPRSDKVNLFHGINVSLYDYDSSDYEAYTGMPLQPVVDNLKWLVNNYTGMIQVQLVMFDKFNSDKEVEKWCQFVVDNFGDNVMCHLNSAVPHDEKKILRMEEAKGIASKHFKNMNETVIDKFPHERELFIVEHGKISLLKKEKRELFDMFPKLKGYKRK